MDGLIAFEFCPLCATDWEIWKAEGNEGRGPWGQLSKSMSRNKFQKKWWDGSFFILQRKVVKLSEQLHFWTIYVVDRKKPSLSLRKQLWLHLNISSMETQVHPAHANVRHSSACLEDVYCSWLKHSLCVSFIDDCCRITMEMHGAQKHHETSLQRIDSVQRCQEDLTKMQLFSSRMKTPTTHQVPSCSCQIFKHQDHQVEHTWTYLNIACGIVEQLEVHHFLGDHSIFQGWIFWLWRFFLRLKSSAFRCRSCRSCQVMLAASELGPYIPGIGQAYHTSVLIDNEESSSPGDQNVGKYGKITLW